MNGTFYSVLQYIGPAADAAKYRYKVEFFNKECTESLAVTLLARSWDEDVGEVHSSGKCVKLYQEQFNCFANESSELALSIEIQFKTNILVVNVKDLKLYNKFIYCMVIFVSVPICQSYV